MVSLLSNILDSRKNLGKIVLVTGDFNILHPGHIRLLRFAKECGDTLVVAVNADSLVTASHYYDQEHRSDIVASLEFVDFCIVNAEPVEDLIAGLNPNAVVKGREYEGKFNAEKLALENLGGKLIFSSGYTFQKSSSVFQHEGSKPLLNVAKVANYIKSHDITREQITRLIENFSQLKILVIGDTIIDEYMQCNAVGMSQEDPTIVVTPDEKKLFLGGAGITSAHAKSLGAQSVSFYTVLGDDEAGKYAEEKISEYQLNGHTFQDNTRPTTQKRRYRLGKKT